MTESTEVRTAFAKASYVRVTPMKARRVIDLIRDMPAQEALSVLKFAPQAASEPVAKVLASAVANAENNLQLDPETLWVKNAYADEGRGRRPQRGGTHPETELREPEQRPDSDHGGEHDSHHPDVLVANGDAADVEGGETDRRL